MKLTIKIFIPKSLFEVSVPALFYGECVKQQDSVKFFIISQCQRPPDLVCIATTGLSCTSPDFVEFIASESKNLRLKTIIIDKSLCDSKNATIVVYDGFESVDISNSDSCRIPHDDTTDFVHLLSLLSLKNARPTPEGNNRLRARLHAALIQIFAFISYLVSPLESVLKQTAIFRHFSDWTDCLRRYNLQNGRSWTLFFDIGLGLLSLALLLQLHNPGAYVMQFTKLVVNNLRHFLESLKGSPVGLKLNVLLNNFFLDCFIYHVDLWWTFLVVMAPVIQYLFIPLAVLGLLGFSFQLAMLSDLLTIISLHAHCFYIYAAVLYKIEVVGIKALWRVVRGRRKNVLRGRVESHEYVSRQLFLATMFFAALLFLLPTVLVYYIVFASLRFGIYCVTYLLMAFRRRIIVFPIFTLYRWLKGAYLSADCIEMRVLDSYKLATSRVLVTVLMIVPKPAVPWKRSLFQKAVETKDDNGPLSIGRFFSGLIQGEMMGFIQPEQGLNGKAKEMKK